jgi:D-lyxose ketol-isomerase
MVPNIRKVKAFRVQPGMGICLKPGIWHTVFVLADEVTYVH